MRIPQRLAYVLERDQELDGAVKLSLAQLEPWIKHSNLPFFPEYTKHDIEHIEAVLRTAVALIRDDAWEGITPADAAALTLGVLLHDCAMHLLEDGFVSLLEPCRSNKTIPGMGDQPWLVLWEDFCGEATRFDGHKLMRLFGDTVPVRRPPLETSQMTMRDRLLIGEFLRRHHPRLAQEIALYGVPTKNASPLIFQGFSGSKSYIAELSGLIARSHGADIRSFIPFLRHHFDIRQYKGVHAVFLMTLLRVADYIQIEAERAPAQVLQVKELASPVSVGEWKAHHAIKDIRNTHEDPEALFVDASPEDVQTFFRVQEWVKGIQQELDASWAVLGEVYGRYEGLNKLGLVLRRIRSTLDDPEEFSKNVSYLPVKAAFRGSDADLLKLLIEPLYGNRPEIGLRELMQNSVDAVRELKQYIKDIPSLKKVPLIDQPTDVVVSIEKVGAGETWIIVNDKGIGMSPMIVVDYFLTAGASFRRSEDWRKMFETEEGKSKVLRAGRFGIGALAAFLLGPEMQVSTRRVDQSEGLEFRASVDTEFIELRRVDRPVGTTVKVRIHEWLVDKLRAPRRNDFYYPDEIDWDWYCLSEPSVQRKIQDRELNQRYLLPGSGEPLQAGSKWHRISHPDYEDVLWTYAEVPELVCNGIRVRSKKWLDLFPESTWTERFALKVPSVSVFDPDGRLPLNLQRTDPVGGKYPFDSELATDVIRDFIAYSLVFGPTSMPSVDDDHSSRYEGVERRSLGSYQRSRGHWYYTQTGFGYVDASILYNEGFESWVIANFDSGEALNDLDRFSSSPTIITDPPYSSESDNWLRTMIQYVGGNDYPVIWMDNEGNSNVDNDEVDDWSLGGEDTLQWMKIKGGRILVSSSTWDRIVKTSRIRKSLRDFLSEEFVYGGWHLFRTGNCPETSFDFRAFISSGPRQKRTMIAEVYLDLSKPPEPSPIGLQWMQVLESAEIPYDDKQRRRVLKHAYEELAPYVTAHEKNKRDRNTKQ